MKRKSKKLDFRESFDKTLTKVLDKSKNLITLIKNQNSHTFKPPVKIEINDLFKT